MAKVSMIQRDRRRQRLVRSYAKRRAAARATIKDPNSTLEQRLAAQETLQRMPRDSSPTRLRNRCSITGRPRGYYRRFGLGRNKLREAAMRGDIPGLTKASW